MDAKQKLKNLASGELSINEALITDGTYADDEKIYEVTGAVGIYREKKPNENTSKYRPLKLLEKLQEDSTMIFLPDNRRNCQKPLQ